MLGRELRSWGYLKSLHKRELRSYPQVSKYILVMWNSSPTGRLISCIFLPWSICGFRHQVLTSSKLLTVARISPRIGRERSKQQKTSQNRAWRIFLVDHENNDKMVFYSPKRLLSRWFVSLLNLYYLRSQDFLFESTCDSSKMSQKLNQLHHVQTMGGLTRKKQYWKICHIDDCKSHAKR